jgi:hypothetical protein
VALISLGYIHEFELSSQTERSGRADTSWRAYAYLYMTWAYEISTYNVPYDVRGWIFEFMGIWMCKNTAFHTETTHVAG